MERHFIPSLGTSRQMPALVVPSRRPLALLVEVGRKEGKSLGSDEGNETQQDCLGLWGGQCSWAGSLLC